MPFGINSAPEVRWSTVNEIMEKLSEVEVIADNFLVVGFGESSAEASKSHMITSGSFSRDINRTISH